MKISRRKLLIISMAYIYIPLFIFVLGWTRVLFAISTIFACMFCFYRFWKEERESQDHIVINLKVFIFIIVFFIIIGYFSGYGRFIEQPSDWEKHNAILYDLIQKDWPVIYSNNGEESMLTYYLGQYIVPGIIGKIFNSMRIAELMLYAWNILGLVLVFLNVLIFTKAVTILKQIAAGFMLPFFSIPLWLSVYLMRMLSNYNYYSSGNWFFYSDDIKIQYSNNFTLLKWVFPQTIPIWLMIIVFMMNRDKIKYFIFILSPSLFFGTLTFIGIFPLAVVEALRNLYQKCVHQKSAKIKTWFLQVFSIENVAVFMTFGIISLLYLLGNVIGEKPTELGFSLMPYTSGTIYLYFGFIAFNILPYAVLLFKRYKKDSIYYVSIATLLILPFFKMGFFNDLIMRASIPALFILMIYVFQDLFLRIEEFLSTKTRRVMVSIILTVGLLGVGLRYPLVEMAVDALHEDYSTLGESGEYTTLEGFANRSLSDVGIDMKYNYYSYDIEDNIFCKYIMKR